MRSTANNYRNNFIAILSCRVVIYVFGFRLYPSSARNDCPEKKIAQNMMSNIEFLFTKTVLPLGEHDIFAHSWDPQGCPGNVPSSVPEVCPEVCLVVCPEVAPVVCPEVCPEVCREHKYVDRRDERGFLCNLLYLYG